MKALLLVDIQNDFCRDGALEVPGAEEIIPVANTWIDQFHVVLATQDWHPPDHSSFATNHPGKKVGETVRIGRTRQLLWPEHCVQESWGAQFHPDIEIEEVDTIIQKGVRPELDSYSGFFDNAGEHATGLHDELSQRGVTDLYVLGLATDYCVKYTVLDGINLGYRVFLVAEGCRAVGIKIEDEADAIATMQEAGAVIIPDRRRGE